MLAALQLQVLYEYAGLRGVRSVRAHACPVPVSVAGGAILDTRPGWLATACVRYDGGSTVAVPCVLECS